MEKQPLLPEIIANFEGNATEVLFRRLHNINIRNQIIDILIQNEQSKIGTFIESLEVDEKGDLVFNDSGEPIVKEKVHFVPKTRQELEESYDETLAKIEAFTEIAMSKDGNNQPTSEEIYIGSIAPWSGRPYTTKQMSIIEAHEKGHRIREYFGDFFDSYITTGFDFSNISYGEDEASVFRKVLGPEDKDKPLEEVKQMFIDYISMPIELVERMSQLKNYYGMSGNEVFTKEHLDYARAHYISDTDMDNGMTRFFQAITPHTEGNFLKLINSVGV